MTTHNKNLQSRRELIISWFMELIFTHLTRITEVAKITNSYAQSFINILPSVVLLRKGLPINITAACLKKRQSITFCHFDRGIWCGWLMSYVKTLSSSVMAIRHKILGSPEFHWEHLHCSTSETDSKFAF